MTNRRISQKILFCVPVAVVVLALWTVDAFQSPHLQQKNRDASYQQQSSRAVSSCTTALLGRKSSGDNDVAFDNNDNKILKERLQNLQLHILEEELARPPNNSALTPIQVVQAILEGLLEPYDPLPDSGFRLLLQTATKKWRKAIMNSVGAKDATQSELVASALESSMGRPHNQFAILVGEGEEYTLDFSASDPVLDFGDGTCWVECHLRDKKTGELLVMTGWDLCQREEDGAWLVDWMYWQDFREEFRPGIGREEWMVEV